MQKLIAFDLYQRNERGAHEKALATTERGVEVYLAATVDALLADVKESFGHFHDCECETCMRMAMSLMVR